jgi:hypothetical protein
MVFLSGYMFKFRLKSFACWLIVSSHQDATLSLTHWRALRLCLVDLMALSMFIAFGA